MSLTSDGPLKRQFLLLYWHQFTQFTLMYKLMTIFDTILYHEQYIYIFIYNNWCFVFTFKTLVFVFPVLFSSFLFILYFTLESRRMLFPKGGSFWSETRLTRRHQTVEIVYTWQLRENCGRASPSTRSVDWGCSSLIDILPSFCSPSFPPVGTAESPGSSRSHMGLHPAWSRCMNSRKSTYLYHLPSALIRQRRPCIPLGSCADKLFTIDYKHSTHCKMFILMDYLSIEGIYTHLISD